MSISNSVLAQYEKSKSNSTGGNEKRMSEEDRMKRYFTTFLPKGTKSGEKRIRIIPTEDGSTPFKEIFFHEMKVGENQMKLYDPAQDGKRSPLNEVHEGLKMTGDPTDKELAKNYRSKKFYIVKVIDRDHEEDGPKFWRFKHNFKNDGIFDKIVPLFKNKGDITDKNEGRDLIITLSVIKGNNGNEYTSVTSIIPEDKSPLHEDESVASNWMSGELKWEDVYSVKPEEYLLLVAEGKTPKYDTNFNKWVAKEDDTDEGSYDMGASNEGGSESNDSTSNQTVDPQSGSEADDDLPF